VGKLVLLVSVILLLVTPIHTQNKEGVEVFIKNIPIRVPILHIKVAGRYPAECAILDTENIEDLLPCAWRRAQLEVSRKFPTYEGAVYHQNRPKVYWRNGKFKVGEKNVFGVVDNGRVYVAKTGDVVEDFDTMVHEFKHRCTFQLPTKKMTKWVMSMWVDMVDSRWEEESRQRHIKVLDSGSNFH
jgi:hypothetical protein